MTVAGDLFQSAFRASPIGMAVLDESGKVVAANPSYVHLLGREASDVVGRPFSEFTHPDDLNRDRDMFGQVASGSLSHGQIHKRYVDGRGNTVWARVTLTEVGPSKPGSARRFVTQVEDVTEHHKTQDLLEKRALYDQLTGLPKVALLIDRLGHALESRTSRSTTVGVLVCDIDHFSVVNDSLGYEAGNTLLTIVAQRIQVVARPGDTVAHHNADQFIVVLENIADDAAARTVAETIARAVRAPIPLGDHEIVPTLSIGIAIAKDEVAAETLIRDADTAMLSAKEAGRSRIELFRPDLRKVALNQLAVEAGLRTAVREGSLVVHYQPIVDLETREIWAYEALVRWEHPARGLLLPDEFIEISEKANLVASLGSFVLEEACDFAARHPDFDGRVFVNVSTRQIGSANLAQAVKSALAASGIDPDRLFLEITETGMLLATEASRVDLENVAALGTTLVLDDFGQGYSSLSAILQNPISALKLSKEYTDRLGEPSGDRVSSAIAMLIAGLGITGIIEGIETEDQHAAAVRHGWKYGQGFLFGRPLPENELSFEPSPTKDASQTEPPHPPPPSPSQPSSRPHPPLPSSHPMEGAT